MSPIATTTAPVEEELEGGEGEEDEDELENLETDVLDAPGAYHK